MRLLLDADATLALRKLSLWKLLLASSAELHITGYVAQHELSSVWSSELEPLVLAGRIVRHDVKAKTPEYAKWRELQRAGADKGEAEAIAWASALAKTSRPTFVTADHGAAKHARREGVEAFDLGELAAELIVSEVVLPSEVRAKIAVWDDVSQEQGRPHGWTTLAQSLPALLARRRSS